MENTLQNKLNELLLDMSNDIGEHLKHLNSIPIAYIKEVQENILCYSEEIEEIINTTINNQSKTNNMETTNQNYKVADATNSNINDIINQVSASQGSLFTKDDVITVLRMINVIDKPNESESHPYDILMSKIEMINLSLNDKIRDDFPNYFDDITDSELRLSGNEIEVDSVYVDTDDASNKIIEMVNESFNDLIQFINTETE